MYLAWLTTLKKVIDEGSFTRASVSLFISQSAASQQIHQLERFFGAKLIERRGRDLQLTPAGQRVYELASVMEREFEATREQVDELVGKSREAVTIVGPTASLLHLVPSVTARFSMEHPEVGIRTIMKTGHEIVDAVRSGVADLAIVARLSETFRVENTLEVVPIRDEMIVSVASARHHFADMITVTPDQIARERVALGVGGQLRTLIENWFEARAAKLENLMVLASSEESRVVTLENLAIGFLPRYVVEDDLLTGRLVELDIEDFSLSRTTYVIYKKEVQAPARWLLDMLMDTDPSRNAVNVG
jgi:DNA-binding transcriptional LysR family regulator